MNSTTAKNVLYDIFNFFCGNNITLNDIITYGSQFDHNNILLPTNFETIYEEWDYNQRDNEAMKLIPEKYADHVCIRSTANGNCFFNSASLIIYGHEEHHIQLRLAVIIELMANADYYLQQKIFEQDILYRDEALITNMEKVDTFKKSQEYIAELRLMCKPHSWCSMVAFFGLASVLHRPVESLFPNTGSEFMNRIYNCVIMPRQNPHYYPPCIIMWSSLSATDFQNSGKSNHFVPVFKRKSLSYDSNLPQFLEKTIPQDLLSLSFQNNYINLTVDEVESNNDNNIITEKENYGEIQNNIIGLLMGVDNKYIPNIDKLDGYLIYSEAKDFQFTISQEEASSLFIYDIENYNYHWRPWQISHYYLIKLLKEQSEFPPQISISVLKTSETNKNLIKYCYCAGCDKKDQTVFRIIINNMDLI